MGNNKSLVISVRHDGNVRKVTKTDGLRQELTVVMAKPMLNAIADTYEKGITKSFYILATFLQRLISRTPLDEDYTYTYTTVHVTKKGVEETVSHTLTHKKDKDVAQWCWYITDGTQTVMSKTFFNEGCNFLEINNPDEIKKIAEYLIKTFGLHNNRFTIGNANEHAGVLEYGGLAKDNKNVKSNESNSWSESSTPVKGPNKEHGVLNFHSIQAPVGMFRISLAELEEGIAINDSMITYQKRKNVSEADIKRFAQIINKYGTVSSDDIKRFIK